MKNLHVCMLNVQCPQFRQHVGGRRCQSFVDCVSVVDVFILEILRMGQSLCNIRLLIAQCWSSFCGRLRLYNKGNVSYKVLHVSVYGLLAGSWWN